MAVVTLLSVCLWTGERYRAIAADDGANTASDGSATDGVVIASYSSALDESEAAPDDLPAAGAPDEIINDGSVSPPPCGRCRTRASGRSCQTPPRGVCVYCPQCRRHHWQPYGGSVGPGTMAPAPQGLQQPSMPQTQQAPSPQSPASPNAPGQQNAAPDTDGAGQANEPAANTMASNLGAAAASQSVAPFMIGDNLGMGTSSGNSLVLGSPIDQASPVPLQSHSSAPFVFSGHNNYYGTASGLSPSGLPSYTGLSTGTLHMSGMTSTFTPTSGPNYAAVLTHSGSSSSSVYNIDPVYHVSVPTPGVAVIGSVKIAENSSPMPRDRVFFNYSFFDDVQVPPNAFNINRFTPGFEKTFFNRLASIEVRMPVATTLNTGNIISDGTTSTSKLEFGNMSVTFKGLFYRSETLAMSGGMQVQAPTAGPTQVFAADGTPLVVVKNGSTHLMPFVGALYTPNEQFYTQAFLQIDAQANGDAVYVNSFDGHNDLNRIGASRQPAYMYIDLGMGYWLFRNNCGRGITGVAPTLELHHNQSLGSTQPVTSGGFQIGSYAGNIGNTNLVVGSNIQLGQLSSLLAAYCVPVEGGVDKQFAGEFRLLFNRRFGPQGRLTRAQF